MKIYKSFFKHWIYVDLKEMLRVNSFIFPDFNHLPQQQKKNIQSSLKKTGDVAKRDYDQILRLADQGKTEQEICKITGYGLFVIALILGIRKDMLKEEIRISDLEKSAMSDFTRKFAKETNTLMGNASNHIKLVSMKVNKKQDYVTFSFVTERTPKYDDNFNLMVADPKKNFKLKKDNLYTIQIRVLDFFKTLKTTPDKVTNKDIEDVILSNPVKIYSDVPSFHWMGSNYNLSLFDGSIYPTDIQPKHWNKFHGENQFLDKHSGSLLRNIKFYIPQMRQMIKKFVK